MMTKKQLEFELDFYRNKVEELEKMYEEMEQVLVLDNYEKPFKKYSISEMNDLNHINSNAFDWLMENQDKTIYDWNYMCDGVAEVKIQG